MITNNQHSWSLGSTPNKSPGIRAFYSSSPIRVALKPAPRAVRCARCISTSILRPSARICTRQRGHLGLRLNPGSVPSCQLEAFVCSLCSRLTAIFYILSRSFAKFLDLSRSCRTPLPLGYLTFVALPLSLGASANKKASHEGASFLSSLIFIAP